jgi:hypothetical protein
MPDALAVAGLLLVLSPLIGAIPVAYPPLIPIWTTTRERHIATVASHRRAWHLLNLGFGLATLGTAGGIAALTVALAADAGQAALVVALAVAYLLGGVLWCAVLAIRGRTTPALHDLGAAGAEADAAETLLGAAIGGLFAGFVLVTGPAIVGLCAVLALGGTVSVPVAALAALVAAVATGSQIVNGDTIPAVLYPPTMLIGVALLAGWS